MDLYEVAHYEPPHQDLRCLQTELFSSLVVKELSRSERSDGELFVSLSSKNTNMRFLLILGAPYIVVCWCYR